MSTEHTLPPQEVLGQIGLRPSIHIKSQDGVRQHRAQLTSRSVESSAGTPIGAVMEAQVPVYPGDTTAQVEVLIAANPRGSYQVMTDDWQSWGTPHSSRSPLPTGRRVGAIAYERSLGGSTLPFFEPTAGNERDAADEGRSYGWLNLQDGQTGDNMAVGVIPTFDGVDHLQYRRQGDHFVVTVTKELGEAQSQGVTSFRLFLGGDTSRGEAATGNYADLARAFGHELAACRGDIRLMRNRVIGFSWAAEGPGIDETKVRAETLAGRGIIDTFIIDDGWERPDHHMAPNLDKFPNLADLAAEMRAAGITPGIWVSPLIVRGEAARNLPSYFFMQDQKGRPKRLPNMIMNSGGNALMPVQQPFGLDISQLEVREYIIDRMVWLAQQGFDVFKADFLSAPFVGTLKEQDMTPVAYYRHLFGEIREAVRQSVGKEIELIGCGAPMMESIGLFEGMRHTFDSAMPNLEQLPGYGQIMAGFHRLGGHRVTGLINTAMYRDAVATAARRALLYSEAHGLIFDGIHLNDSVIPFSQGRPDESGLTRQERLNEAVIALGRLGTTNLFVGDSLARVGERGQAEWRDYIDRFRTGDYRENPNRKKSR